MALSDVENRIQVFEDTLKRCKANKNLREAIAGSVKAQRIFAEQDETGSPDLKRYQTPAKIVVSKKRSFEAALDYAEERVCVLNFASATNPGGGVAKGSNAQEECLCRCSTLYPCLTEKEVWSGFYGEHREKLQAEQLTVLYNDDCIYTPGVVVFKSDKKIPVIMEQKDWKYVDIITCAAPNLRAKPANRMNPNGGSRPVRISRQDLQKLHEKRARRILEIAALQGAEVLILGAFGCGAFQNPPEVVGAGIREVLKDYQYAFKTIEFAVYCTPRDTLNFDVLRRTFAKVNGR